MAFLEWVKTRIKRLVLPAPQLEWQTGYASWAEAAEASAGYGQAGILQAAIAAARAVVDGRAAYDRDGVTFSEIHYSWPLLASLLYVAQGRSFLRVIDVGGGLGSTYRQNRHLLKSNERIGWCVVEQAEVVEAGTREFATDELLFTTDYAGALADGADLVVFGSSLCYMEEPGEYLARTARSGVRFLAFDRTPFIIAEDDEVTVQRVSMDTYSASYPCWRFSAERFEKAMDRDWQRLLRWDCELQPDPSAVNRGYLFERRV